MKLGAYVFAFTCLHQSHFMAALPTVAAADPPDSIATTFGERYYGALAGANPAELLAYLQGDDNSRALNVKWHVLVQKRVCEIVLGVKGPDLGGLGDVDICEFIGFLEGRLRVQCPEEWQSAIKTCKMTQDGIAFRPEEHIPARIGSQDSLANVDRKLYHAGEVNNGSMISVTTPWGTSTVARRDVVGDERPSHYECVVTNQDGGDEVVVAFHDGISRVGLASIRHKPGSVPWRAVMVTIPYGGITGDIGFRVQFVGSGDRIHAFYRSSRSMGVIVVDKTGKVSDWFATDIMEWQSLDRMQQMFNTD